MKLQVRWAAAGRALIWIVAALFIYKVARAGFLHAEHLTNIDFSYFWNAGREVLQGHADQAYVTHSSPSGEVLALAHPPPFLFLTAPLGLFSFGAALAVWLLVTAALYVVAARVPVRLALANPAAAYCGLAGQTGFLTSAIILSAAHWAKRRPLLAGALFGVLIAKPHLAIFVPVALAAGRHWLAMGAAAASAALLLFAAMLAFGPGIYPMSLHSLQSYGENLVQGAWGWDLLASPYAFVRWFGFGHWPATAVQLVAAITAAILVWQAWRKDQPQKIAVLAAAVLLGSPYLFTYDAVLLVAPIGFLAAAGQWRWATAVWGLSFLPLAATTFLRSSFLPTFAIDLPNMTPIAAGVSLLALAMASENGH